MVPWRHFIGVKTNFSPNKGFPRDFLSYYKSSFVTSNCIFLFNPCFSGNKNEWQLISQSYLMSVGDLTHTNSWNTHSKWHRRRTPNRKKIFFFSQYKGAFIYLLMANALSCDEQVGEANCETTFSLHSVRIVVNVHRGRTTIVSCILSMFSFLC